MSLTNQEYVLNEGGDKACTQVYIQVQCSFDDAQLQKNKQASITIACVSTIAAILYWTALWYFKKMQNLKEKMYDVKNTNAEDFTVQMDITDNMW